MFIAGLGTASPPHRYTQAQCWDAVRGTEQFERLDRYARATVQGVLLRDNGVRTRSLVLDSLDEVFEIDPDTLHRRFVRHAPVLAASAALAAFESTGLRPH